MTNDMPNKEAAPQEVKKIAALPKFERTKPSIGQRFSSYFHSLFLRVSLQEQVIFARHLAIMSKAGMPLLDSIVMLQKQTKSRSLAKILTKVSLDISNGQFLAASLDKVKEIVGVRPERKHSRSEDSD